MARFSDALYRLTPHNYRLTFLVLILILNDAGVMKVSNAYYGTSLF